MVNTIIFADKSAKSCCMRHIKTLISLQLLLSLVCGVLVSEMSFIGRIGINLFHKNYKLFKYWWKTAILFFILFLLLDLFQFLIKRKSPRANLYIFVLLIIGLLGLFASFQDFTTNFSHKLLKEKAHLGFYLFWLTWMGSNIYFLTLPKTINIVDTDTI